MRQRSGSVGRCLLATVIVAASLGMTVTPATAAPLDDIVQLTAGQDHACARLANRQVRCWGEGFSGQLGRGIQDDAGSPVTVLNLSASGPLKGVVSVTAGDSHTCAAMASGEARCWGSNGNGRLGDNTTDQRNVPVRVLLEGGDPLTGVIDVAAGGGHTCALLASGRVRCWGRNDEGELGTGSFSAYEPPTLVKDVDGVGPLRGVVEIDAGLGHTCALLASGQVRCWGADDNGELGDGGPEADSPLPVAVRTPSGPGRLKGVTHIELGEYHACASLESGQVRCWGYNGDGELGDASTDERLRPVKVRAPSGPGVLTDVAEAAAGGSNSCARLETSRARCWGDANDGQLGDGDPTDYRSRPVGVRTASGDPLARIRQIAIGFAFMCARMRSGTARCWGSGAEGQLGDGSFSGSIVPVVVGE